MDEMKKKLQGVDEIDQVEEQKKKKKLDYDEVEDEDGHHNSKLETTKRKVGGIRTMPFILGNEICDRFATSGFHGNMITYLTQVLNLPMVEATNTLSNFGATSSFTPLFGALIADSFAGRFWTITVASIIYLLGLISITISAVVPSLQPRECPSQVNCEEASRLQLWVVYISLLLTCIGTGGIRPCVVTFAADQLDMSKQSASKRSWNFFNWYYLSMGMATLLALTIVVYIQDNVGWGWGLGIPTVAMAISLVVFVGGSPLYLKLKPGGSPFTRLLQVVVAAVRKRRLHYDLLPTNNNDSTHHLLYQNKELDALISLQGNLLHTHQFKWLDKAATMTKEELTSLSGGGGRRPNLWRLATVHRVEELKCILRMLPIWAAAILLVTSSSHQHSFTILQAQTMDCHISHSSSFKFPPASLSIFSVLTMMLGLVVYERVFVPFARRFTGNPAGITCLQRMGVGFAINIVATIVSSLVEMKRKSVASQYHLLDSPKATVPITVFWLVPQFCLHGVAEVFMSVGHLEFLYDQSPESMRSTAAALYWIAIAIGNYVGTILVTLVHKYTNWLPDRNLNRGRLDYYYLLVTAIQLINLIYYLICASCYTQKPLLHLEQHHIITQHDDDDDNHHPTTPELINANPNPPLRDHVELISKA